MTGSIFRSALHYARRIRELGYVGTLRHAWARAKKGVIVCSQSLWWGWRARQVMSDATLLARLADDWGSVETLLSHLASRRASSFLLPYESSEQTAQLLYQHFPEYVSAVITTADAACRNEISLLGQRFAYPQGIDWLSDPVTGWRWPLLHRSRLDHYLGSERPVDLILFWELNRHQHFVALGIAHFLTGKQKYVDAFCTQIQHWIESNPTQHGVNWYYPLEVSIRLLAWTVAFQFFRGSPEFRERTGKAFLKSLWQQAHFLSRHLQATRSDVPNNHMVAELTGLVLVGAAFPEFRDATPWREIGLHLLAQQASAQTHPDGVNREQATGYHRFVAELLLLIVARGRQGELPQEPTLEHTLQRMLDYVFFTLTPVGTVPMWGDSDYGSALGLGRNRDFWDFRPILSAGAVLFARPEWKFAAGRFDEEAFWLLGADGLDLWNQLDVCPPEVTSRAFPHAGLYVIRDEWTTDTDVAFFRCGPFGLGGEGRCAHSHCDLLSFVLWVKGQPLLVDSGTFTYHGTLRDHFRLTAAHNTVMVDGSEQAIPRANFNWQQIPEARCMDWTGKRVIGALTYPGQVEVIRELAHPRPGVWELSDKIRGNDEHTVEWYFHFAPDLAVEVHRGGRLVTVFREGEAIANVIIPDGGIRSQVRNSWYSYQYGVKESNRELYARWKGKLDGEGMSFHWQFLVGANDGPMSAGS